jgi:hypothetical protein
MKPASKPKTTPRDAAAALQHLRGLAREVHQHTLARMEGEIARVMQCVTRASTSKTQRRDIEEMLTLVQRLDVRPHKGRIKDVRRLQKIVGHLSSIVDQW